MKKLSIGLVSILSLISFLPGFAPELRAQAEPFYKGKTIRIVVGSTAGGFYDRWARLLARHMVKHIPGQPEMIVQIMAGAGSVIAANHVYKVAKPDGLTLGMPLNGIYVDQFVGRAEAQYDLRKFHFIGSPAIESNIFYMRADAPYKSIADVIKAKEAAQMRQHRDGEHRLHSIENSRRHGWREVQQRVGIRRRQRDRYRGGKGRGDLPRP